MHWKELYVSYLPININREANNNYTVLKTVQNIYIFFVYSLS